MKPLAKNSDLLSWSSNEAASIRDLVESATPELQRLYVERWRAERHPAEAEAFVVLLVLAIPLTYFIVKAFAYLLLL